MANPTPTTLAKSLLAVLVLDRPRLRRIDDYALGYHDDPYMPPKASPEYCLLAKRSVSNWIPLLISTPAQSLYVDSFRRGNASQTDVSPDGEPVSKSQPEWDHWQRSRLDSRQAAVYRAAIEYGHAFAVTQRENDETLTKGLSPLRTSALFEDPANDDNPYAALTVTKMPKGTTKGKATMWDEFNEYDVTFETLDSNPEKVSVKLVGLHGSQECPVTRFAAFIDLDGRTMGVVEPVIPLQNRINQTVFDLLVTQTYGSFKVRTATGMAPPMETVAVRSDPDDATSAIIGFEPVLNSDGTPKPKEMDFSAKRMLFAEDHEARFGTLDETPLDGFISSIDMSVRHLSAVSQTPPHYLLGQIANLSAEALQAAETALSRKVEEFRKSFGESWERVFRLAAYLDGDLTTAEDFSAEVIWRDMDQRSVNAVADGLGKFAESLGIPKRGLWNRVPNVTQDELNEWDRLADEEPDAKIAAGLERAGPAAEVTPSGDSLTGS